MRRTRNKPAPDSRIRALRIVRWCGGLAAFTVPAAFWIVARADIGQQPARTPASNTHQIAARSGINAPDPADPPADPVSGTVRRPVSFYTGQIRGGMFSEPQPPAPPQISLPANPLPTLPPLEAPVDPFADWSYNGTVTINGQMEALIENTKTKEGQYVRPGSTFLDARVETVTERMVTLRSGARVVNLAKSDAITVKQLDKDAAYLSAPSSAPKAPAAPGQAGPSAAPGAGFQMDMTGGMAITPNGRVFRGAIGRMFRRGMRMGRGAAQGGGGTFMFGN